MNLLKKEWLQLFILAVPFCAAALLWDKLPEKVPSHWNAAGQIDAYSGKTFGILLLPITNAAVALLMAVVPFIDPKLKQQSTEAQASSRQTIRTIRLALTSFFSCFSLLILAVAFGWFRNGTAFAHYIYIGLGMLFIVLGNFMTKLKPNRFVGIRTPWTLASPEVWAKTHRLGGPVMVASGFIMLVMLLVVPFEKYAFYVVLPIVLGMASITSVYSYILYRKESPNTSAVR
ncbi:MAG TPA: SdpI family protein [Verrucomicrobiae bacterium]